MDVTEPLKEAKPLSMSPDAIRSRARRAAKPKPVKPGYVVGDDGCFELPSKAKPRKRKSKVKKKVVRKSKLRAKKRKTVAVVRSERLDMRLTKAEKTKVVAKAKKTRRTVTSLVIEAIEKIK